jgi:hypothetical protein
MMHGRSKNIRVPAKLKKNIHRTELISDFTLNSDDMLFLMLKYLK